MDKVAIIVAAGSGTRMGGDLPKQFLLLRNRPMLWYSITAFLDAFAGISIILVLPGAYLDRGRQLAQSTTSPHQIRVVEGGATRFASVKNGLEITPAHSMVFVHDGVRCLVTPGLIHKCYDAAIANGNAIPAVPVSDTLRMETDSGNEPLDRLKVRIIQTPQTFLSRKLKKAYQQEYSDAFTDDASVLESMGEKIHLVEGEVTNIKITRKIDLIVAEQILSDREKGDL
jgi:2-C-methyl-D-erythritol 4-phosphate cytidylyltransferase